jgi:hypothetical protein
MEAEIRAILTAARRGADRRLRCADRGDLSLPCRHFGNQER